MTPQDVSDVYIFDLGTPNPDLKAVREVVDKVFALTGAPAAFRDKSVLVKPNLVGPFPPEMHVTTSPVVVRAVVDAVRAAGGKPAVGDNPGGIEESSTRTAQIAGIAQAADGCFRNLSEAVEVKTNCRFTDKFIMSKYILDVDYIVNLPVLKTHMLTVLTGAVKNCFGYICGTNKAKLHLSAFSRGRFAELLLDIYAIRSPNLHIVDALWVMEGNGPTHGEVRPVGKIVAGLDGLAVDAVLAMLMGLTPMQVRFFMKAAELEQEGRPPLGRFRPGQVRIFDGDGKPIEMLEPIPDMAMPNTFNVSLEEQAELLVSLGSINPEVNEALCSQCGDCETNCPPGAIHLDPFPVVDPAKCISCFCCAELCTQGAMHVPPGKAAAYFNRMFSSNA